MKITYEFEIPGDEIELSKYELSKHFYLNLDEIFGICVNTLGNPANGDDFRKALEKIKNLTEVILSVSANE